jgi:hypothetical protein
MLNVPLKFKTKSLKLKTVGEATTINGDGQVMKLKTAEVLPAKDGLELRHDLPGLGDYLRWASLFVEKLYRA